jgi:hypothetical protein
MSIAADWHWAFLIVALIASGFYGGNAWYIFVSSEPPSGAQWWHQFWLNFAGAIVGWAAVWLLLRKFGTCGANECVKDVGVLDLVVTLIAFVGVTGHLPNVAVSLVSGTARLAGKLVEVLTAWVATTLK